MAGRRSVVVCVIFGVLAAGGANLRARGAGDDPSAGRVAVRGEWAMASRLIDTGAARSATIRDLIDELDRSDVLVYVDIRFDTSSAEGATVLAGGRTLRVFVSAKLDSSRRLEILGHELMHCVEIAHAPSVHDAGGLKSLEHVIGRRSGSDDAFETTAARAVERRVHAELAAR